MNNYISLCKTTEISATSRVAIKIHDNFYTVEYSEKRAVPDIDGIDLEQERIILFDDVNNIVDGQCNDILNAFQNKKR